MLNNRSSWRILPVVVMMFVMTGCYTESNPLPVRFMNAPNDLGGEWQCQPVSGGACLSSPINYEGKRGCNNSWNNWCKTSPTDGQCKCVAYGTTPP